ncbi:hypothetical protein L2E82_13182 [Cichorium intybus]|uniref:Uncharacterized protein n=1 Tax=Cichorium intybus TaxID=13427 RepID=A0ACB9GI46_CICIN|nr:hypothetical protein L2E82_13182 [Cichorium intybus]
MKVKTITLKILNSSKDFMRHGASGNDKGNKALIFYARPNRERNTIRATITVEELAEMIFGSVAPVESYCAHLLLSRDEIYFTVLDSKGSSSVYDPRPTVQVEEMKRRILAKEAADKEFNEFLELLKSAKAMPQRGKPSKSSWKVEEKIWYRIEFLEAFAIDASKDDAQRNTVGAAEAAGVGIVGHNRFIH